MEEDPQPYPDGEKFLEMLIAVDLDNESEGFSEK